MQVSASRSGLPLFEKHHPVQNWGTGWTGVAVLNIDPGVAGICAGLPESQFLTKIPVNDLSIPNQHFGKLTLRVWYNVFVIIGFFRLFLPSEMRQNWLCWTLESSFFIEVQAINWNSLGFLCCVRCRLWNWGVSPKFKHPLAFLVWFWILFLTNSDAPVDLHSPKLVWMVPKWDLILFINF